MMRDPTETVLDLLARHLLEPVFHVHAKRLFHGRGGLHPGLEWCVIDDFGRIVLLTLFAQPPHGFLQRVAELYASQADVTAVEGLAVQHRYLSGAPTEWLAGEPRQAYAHRGALRFNLRFDRQNVGFFLDMEPGRSWLAERAAGKKILNLFAYTCAFSVVAVHAEAASVVNVDMSRSALTEGRENHRLNRLSTNNVQFMALDVLKSWSRIRKPGPYDVVIVDPPSYQKGSFVARKDYAKVLRRLDELTASGAEALLCLNAPEVGSDFLSSLMAVHAPNWVFAQRLPAAPEFADCSPERQLKLLHYVRR